MYNSCGAYYYFYRSFNEAVKDGGWLHIGGTNEINLADKTITHSKSNKALIDNKYGRYITGGINRYALFFEGKQLHIEESVELSLSDEDIEMQYGTSSLIILYLGYGEQQIKPDVLIKDYDLFYPISYHKLDKKSLNDNYIITDTPCESMYHIL